jgi:hypothetical protein
MSDRDCQRCHGNPNLKVTRGGKTVSLFVNEAELGASRHAGKACVQCHTGGTPSTTGPAIPSPQGGLLHLPRRPGESVPREHARPTGAQGEPGRARLPGLPRSARHPGQNRFSLAHVLAQRAQPVRQVPQSGQKAALRYTGKQEPHRRALLRRAFTARDCWRAGLTVTANCADCHTAHTNCPPAIRAPASTAPTSPSPAPSATAASTKCSHERPQPGGHAKPQSRCRCARTAIRRTASSAPTSPISGCTS